jgi:hypothetical protein
LLFAPAAQAEERPFTPRLELAGGAHVLVRERERLRSTSD